MVSGRKKGLIMDEYIKYLQCFVKNSTFWYDRCERHRNMLHKAICDVRPELLNFPLSTIKGYLSEITDNLNKSIDLPLDGYFNPEDYSEKLKHTIENAVQSFDIEALVFDTAITRNISMDAARRAVNKRLSGK